MRRGQARNVGRLDRRAAAALTVLVIVVSGRTMLIVSAGAPALAVFAGAILTAAARRPALIAGRQDILDVDHVLRTQGADHMTIGIGVEDDAVCRGQVGDVDSIAAI